MILKAKQNTESKNFECSLCAKLFADFHQLEIHYEQIHEKSESNVGNEASKIGQNQEENGII